MKIIDIAKRINSLATVEKFSFAKIQEIRSKYGIKPRSKSPFAVFSIKNDYAFHAGGRKEFQFNIGLDQINDKPVFRYGLAFSLKEDKTLQNSKVEFKSKIERFNYFFSTNSDFFKGFAMWYYSGDNLIEYYDSVRSINGDMFQAENFIFIGHYFLKDLNKLSEKDFRIILTTFDYLLPFYEFVQFGEKRVEKRIARLCWNDNGWVMPSGHHGKSKHVGSHEAVYGYGHEEWLFDTSKLINGYHYGFLEPIRKQHAAFEGNTYDVWLYAINGETKERKWVGEIRNIEVLSKEKAEEVKAEYIRRDWLREMEAQIKEWGANSRGFSDWKGVDIFNIRFLPENIELNDPPIEIPKNHPINRQSRYTFLCHSDDYEIQLNDNKGFCFISSDDDNDKDLKPISRFHFRKPRTVEILYLHDAISRGLTKELRKIYGKDKVSRELSAGYGASRIDVVVKDENDMLFYEIKTYPVLRTSIREAIGQLLEYCSWTNEKRAKKLIVVTQPHGDIENAKIYFEHLRVTFNLPIFFQTFDAENNILSEVM